MPPEKPQSDAEFFDQSPDALATPDRAREAAKRLDAIVLKLRKARAPKPATE